MRLRNFGEISKTWTVCPLRSFGATLHHLRETTTQTGLRVRAHLVTEQHATGVMASDEVTDGLGLKLSADKAGSETDALVSLLPTHSITDTLFSPQPLIFVSRQWSIRLGSPHGTVRGSGSFSAYINQPQADVGAPGDAARRSGQYKLLILKVCLSHPWARGFSRPI